jgi:hypothetical protein
MRLYLLIRSWSIRDVLERIDKWTHDEQRSEGLNEVDGGVEVVLEGTSLGATLC